MNTIEEALDQIETTNSSEEELKRLANALGVDAKNIFINEAPTLKIRYHKELYPDLPEVEQHGNFIDVFCAETVMLNKGDFHLLDLGISVECPKGYWLQLVPRSSTYKNWGIIQTNSFGVVDTNYCGDNDIIRMPILAMKDVCIPANTRICQFRLVEDIPFNIKSVDKLEGSDRGGFGSTGNYKG